MPNPLDHLPFWSRRRADPGAPPGTLVADPETPPPSIRMFGYDAETCVEGTATTAQEVGEFLKEHQHLIRWIDVAGLRDLDPLRALGTLLEIHPLALEDVLNTHQRPKLDEYDRQQFLVLRMVDFDARGKLDSEQVSLFLGPGWMITFQERPGDCLDPIRERIRLGRGRIRHAQADYLLYALVDAIVDHFFPVVDTHIESLLKLEAEVVSSPQPLTLQGIYTLRRDLVAMRRMVSPLREVLGYLARGELETVTPETRLYFRDAQDHSFQVLEAIDACRETTSGLMDLYQNSLAQRTNEVMKVLTMIATLFIPLSFLAGLYGMNFDREASPWNMPELGWGLGYPALLSVMALVTVGMLGFFYRKGWLGSSTPAPQDTP